MTLAPDAAVSACYLRLLANWGLGLAGLPLVVDDENADPAVPAGPEPSATRPLALPLRLPN